jgi:SAM-dependent methyltransferase
MSTALSPQNCVACQSTDHEIIHTREMMFGTRDPFTYSECCACGCLSLLNVPENLAQYYPSDYYSFSNCSPLPNRTRLKSKLNRTLNAGCIFGHSPISWLLSKLRPNRDFQWLKNLLKNTGIKSFDTKILDVGCGSGELLNELADAGFEQLVGIDPFAKSRNELGGRLRIIPTTLDKFQEADFRLVMSHHSLEHTRNHLDTLSHIRRVMNDDGMCIIRIPLAGSDPFRKYRENWVEFDPPRHLVIQSRTSFEHIVKVAGLRIENVIFDESAFAYWGSELYKNNTPLFDPDTRKMIVPERYFSASRLAEFQELARTANLRGAGGRAMFHLRKA